MGSFGFAVQKISLETANLSLCRPRRIEDGHRDQRCPWDDTLSSTGNGY